MDVLTRRDVIRAGGVALLAATGVGACSADPPGGEGEGGPAGGPDLAQKEAPMLAARVEAGDLPPLEERLPSEPLVVEPNEETGVYGGTWHMVMSGPNDLGWPHRTVAYQHLTRWKAEDYSGVLPNVPREYSISDDGTQITFVLREGMRWSDGAPFTADDLVFVHDDVLSNTELYPVPLYATTLEKIDDYTVVLTFADPAPLFLQGQAEWSGNRITGFPRHYLERFHKKYNSEVEELAADEGYESWVQLFNAKAGRWENPDLPRLDPWIQTNAVGDGQRWAFEWNPYFWKVDSDGRQLPYLDRVEFDIVSDNETILLRATDGELDLDMRHVGDLRNRPVLAGAREDGNFRLVDLVPISSAFMLTLNLTHKDPIKREIFQNRDFRVGLSYAIDREEIIKTVFAGQSEPYQAAPREGSVFYDEEMAKQYTEYGVDLANEHLDRAGYTQKNDDGIRLGPDGSPIAFTVEVGANDSEGIDTLGLIKTYLRDVGVDMQVKAEALELFTERMEANEHDAGTKHARGAIGEYVVLRADWWLPVGFESQWYAPLWDQWYASGGVEGEEPPQEVKEQMDLYDTVVSTTDEEERILVMKEILRASKEYFYHIGICLIPDQTGVVSNDFHNVPDSIINGDSAPGPSNPEQYFTTASD